MFESYFPLRSACPSCGYRLERESAYWVGALIVNIAVVESVCAVLFVATILATAPEIPWWPLLVVGLATNGILPVSPSTLIRRRCGRRSNSS